MRWVKINSSSSGMDLKKRSKTWVSKKPRADSMMINEATKTSNEIKK
jgi:hypothetical protein